MKPMSVFKTGLATLSVIGIMGFSVVSGKKCTLDLDEEQKAFQYLNEFRQHPVEYGNAIKLHLNKVEPRPVLKWDTILAKVAEEKAMDMAKNDYFAHINNKGEGINIMVSRAGYTVPDFALKDKKNNWYESIAWQGGNKDFAVDAKMLINSLITDKGVASLGHRKHLLGIDDDAKHPFDSRLTDIGIGYAIQMSKDNTFKCYMSVVIASHN
jgi:uncharacterized protein YkwD